MKTLLSILTVTTLVSGVAFAETATMTQERTQVQSQVQNRFQQMSTDELLEKHRSATSQQEREQLRYELMNRQQNMTKDQYEKLMNRAENRVQNRVENRTMNAYKENRNMMDNMGGGSMMQYGAPPGRGAK
jgi:uncharacterized membrane protein YheB (UPF0754 family)